MEDFLLNTPDFRRLYNCSFYEVDSVQLVQRRQVILGLALTGISVVEEVCKKRLYIHYMDVNAVFFLIPSPIEIRSVLFS
jgi:hypothetical protein